MPSSSLPSSPEIHQGYLRIDQIIGNSRTNPPKPALIPISRSTWYRGIQSGKFPRPIRLGQLSLWKVSDILQLMKEIENEAF